MRFTWTTSDSGFRYFLIFVDDFSHMTWLHLLKDRSQVLTVIKQFYNEIKTQFSTTVKIFRTNNAMEFVKFDFFFFCTEINMIHHTSFSHTFQ